MIHNKTTGAFFVIWLFFAKTRYITYNTRYSTYSNLQYTLQYVKTTGACYG